MLLFQTTSVTEIPPPLPTSPPPVETPVVSTPTIVETPAPVQPAEPEVPQAEPEVRKKNIVIFIFYKKKKLLF